MPKSREDADIPAEESPLTAARRQVLQRQESSQGQGPSRSLWSLLGRQRSPGASAARTRAERRAERWERHRNFERTRFEVGDGEDFQADGPNALGATAYLESLRIQKMVNSAQNFQPRARQQISPIAKAASKSSAQKKELIMEETEKALTLEQWFDAGLCLGPVVKSKKMPPGGYEVAAWSEDVPFLKHLRTGVVLWPIRFNLLPFFEALEGQMAYRRLVTVYHYTTGSGFNRIIARFDNANGEFPEAHDFAEELWDRCPSREAGIGLHSF